MSERGLAFTKHVGNEAPGLIWIIKYRLINGRGMRLTSQEEYGLRCLLQVARASLLERTVSIREVATYEGLGVE